MFDVSVSSGLGGVPAAGDADGSAFDLNAALLPAACALFAESWFCEAYALLSNA